MEKDDTVDVLTFDLAIKVVYKELCRKLCHTRLGEYKDEYISATQQNLAALKGKSTLAGQNLRDELLTSHVNTKSCEHKVIFELKKKFHVTCNNYITKISSVSLLYIVSPVYCFLVICMLGRNRGISR